MGSTRNDSISLLGIPKIVQFPGKFSIAIDKLKFKILLIKTRMQIQTITRELRGIF